MRVLPKVSPQAKIKLQQLFFRIKQFYGFNQEDIHDLILWVYVHNPLGEEDLAAYGNAELLVQSASKFKTWKKHNGRLCETHGVRHAIFNTIDSETATDDFLTQLFAVTDDI